MKNSDQGSQSVSLCGGGACWMDVPAEVRHEGIARISHFASNSFPSRLIFPVRAALPRAIFSSCMIVPIFP